MMGFLWWELYHRNLTMMGAYARDIICKGRDSRIIYHRGVFFFHLDLSLSIHSSFMHAFLKLTKQMKMRKGYINGDENRRRRRWETDTPGGGKGFWNGQKGFGIKLELTFLASGDIQVCFVFCLYLFRFVCFTAERREERILRPAITWGGTCDHMTWEEHPVTVVYSSSLAS